MIDVLRFFLVVPPVHPLMTRALGAALTLAAAAFAVDVEQAEGAVVLILLLQALAASSGFVGPARRGHYDLLLTRGLSRLKIALGHWAMSVAPGLGAWAIVAAMETIVRQGWAALSLSAGTLAALLLVSTLPWAATVRLPRLTGCLVCMLLFAVAVTVVPAAPRETWADSGAVYAAARSFVAAVVWPWMLVGRDLAGQVPGVVTAGCAAAAAMAAAFRWIDRAEVPLEAAQ